MHLLWSAIFFFKINLNEKFFEEHYHSVKRFGSRLDPDVLYVLILVQTVCKGYQ